MGPGCREHAAAAVILLFPAAAGARSLESSTISLRTSETSAEVTISVAVETVASALATDDPDDATIVTYLDEHLTVTGSDGQTWTETWWNAEREQVEGIESFSVDVALDPPAGGSDVADGFTITYDAVIEAVTTHKAVVVLTEPTGDISSPGIIDATSPSLGIGAAQAMDAGATAAGFVDMIGLRI